MKKLMRITMAQVDVTVGDLDGNRRKIVEGIGRAQRLHSDIVIFSELAVCGYPPEDLLFKRHFVENNIRSLDDIVKQTGDIIAIVGFAEPDKKGHLYNAAAVISKGRLYDTYHKIALPDYGVFDEKKVFYIWRPE